MPASLRDFTDSALQNLRSYNLCLQFWWPIIDARAKLGKSTVEDLLLNPVFRWVFLNRLDKLKAFENQLANLESALGTIQFKSFHQQLLADTSTHSIENFVHNRILSAMTEIRAILRYFSDDHGITLIPRHEGRKTPDFSAEREGRTRLVEVKYIRPPDKLEEYLLRWWQAKKELAQSLPQGALPHVKFEWTPVESRDELTREELLDIKEFFTAAYQHPDEARELLSGRVVLKYLPNRRLPAAVVPLDVRATLSETNRGPLFTKLHVTIKSALEQLDQFDKAKQRTVFLAINLSTDIQFLWHYRFHDRMEALCREFADLGLELVVEEVSYL